MELQLEKQKRTVYEKVLDRTEEAACSADFVVPDALADVGALLLTEGVFTLHRLDFEEQRARLEGCVSVCVCYTAEQTGVVCSFPVELPVKLVLDADTLSPEARPFAVCALSGLEAQLVNSRKLRVRASVAVHLRAWRAATLELVTGVSGGEGIYANHAHRRFHAVVAVEEKTFTAAEEHPLRLSRPEGGRLLSHSERVLLDEQKLVGNRVILQGRVVASVLYCQEGRAAPVTETFETPFSQMLEGGADTEFGCVCARVQLTAVYHDYSAELGANGGVQAEYHLVAQALCLAQLEADCMDDAYSNAAQLELVMQEQTVLEVTAAEPLRAVAEATVAAEGTGLSVCGSRCALLSVEAADGAVGGRLDVTVLLTSADGAVSSVRRELRFSQPAGEGRLELTEVRLEDPYLAVTAEGVSVRVPVTAAALSVRERPLLQVSEISAGAAPAAWAALPSVTLVRPAAGDSLWSLAKRYCSSEAAIRTVNGLDAAQETADMPPFLLIPRLRA